jgi:peptide chain release factor 3
MSNDLVLGAVGTLQFDVVAYRLKDEYGVDASFEPVTIATARWVKPGPKATAKKMEEFREKAAPNLSIDAAGELVYLAPSRVNLQLTIERWPDLEFAATREHAHAVAVE